MKIPSHKKSLPSPPLAQQSRSPWATAREEGFPPAGGDGEPLIRVDDEEEEGPYSPRSTPQGGGYGIRSEEGESPLEVEDRVELRQRSQED